MAERMDDYAFEQFPRGEIHFTYSRRRFLSALMTEMRVFNKSDDGHVGRKLSDLGAWPDQDLLCVAPVIAPEAQIEPEDGSLTGFSPSAGRGEPVVLFSLELPAYQVYLQFNGLNSLTEIAGNLAQQTGWSEDKAFAYTRGVFLSLVVLGLARPRYS